ncbi:MULTISPECIES: hypothetical protein [Clostridium]|uniref:DUF2746 domain-containing protein n=1 Tax=Clostridium frigoriphilum TaxID=443253 RepID=A0ABU7UU51_9CLOT|nr:hypothetical protein [Clostridium sp. DSM 17811]MBU3102450.1 hypothetical protein [Clostridium sp. DSM 17811]
MSTVTVTIVILAAGAICAIVGSVLAVSNLFRTSRKEATTEATADAQSTTRLETKLDYVSKGVDDIRLDNKDQNRRINDISDKVARVEESTKSAHKRLDELEK